MYQSYSLSYFPFESANLFEGCIQPSAVRNDSVAYAFWCRSLYQRLCSVIEFELPEEWKRASDFFEACLFGRGYVAVFDSARYGLTFQPCTISGYDLYYQPTKAQVSNPLLNIELKIGTDTELIRLTNDFHGAVDIIAYYAEKLATIDGAVNMALINSKFAYVLGAKNKAAAQAIKMLFDKVNRGEPLVIYDRAIVEGLGNDEPFEFIDRSGLKNSYITSDLLSDFQTLINQFDSEIGIPTLPAEKRERMITDEAHARDADASARVSLWKESLTRSIDMVNEKFGTDISFRFKYLEENISEENTDESLEDNISRRISEWESAS